MPNQYKAGKRMERRPGSVKTDIEIISTSEEAVTRDRSCCQARHGSSLYCRRCDVQFLETARMDLSHNNETRLLIRDPDRLPAS